MKMPSRYLLTFAAVGVLVAACGGDDAVDTDEAAVEEPADEGDDAADEGDGGESDDGSDSDAAGTDLDALYASAQDEGAVIAYVAAAESAFQATIEGFNETYPGVDVEFVRLNSSAIAQRFGAERDSGAPTADIVLHGAVEFHLDALDAGWVLPVDQLPLPEAFPADFVDPLVGPVIGHPLPVILYNTDLVAEEDIPTTWEDLADPRWQGELLMADLEEQAWHVGVYGTVVDEFGEEWAEGFMANEPRVIAGGVAPITELVAAGEAAVAPIGYAPIAEAVKASGAPVDYTTPDPQTSVPSFVAINADAEHPNASRLFFHYMHTEDGVERLTLFGTHAPYQTDRGYEWIPDDLQWATDPDYVASIRELFGQ